MDLRTPDRRQRETRDEHWSWIGMIATHAIGGMILGGLVAYFIIHYDINRIGTMLGHSGNRFGFTLLLFAGFASLFGMVASGTAIWFRSIEKKDD